MAHNLIAHNLFIFFYVKQFFTADAKISYLKIPFLVHDY